MDQRGGRTRKREEMGDWHLKRGCRAPGDLVPLFPILLNRSRVLLSEQIQTIGPLRPPFSRDDISGPTRRISRIDEDERFRKLIAPPHPTCQGDRILGMRFTQRAEPAPVPLSLPPQDLPHSLGGGDWRLELPCPIRFPNG